MIKQKSIQLHYRLHKTQGTIIKPSYTDRKTTPKRNYANPPQNFARKAPPKKENIETMQVNEIKMMFMNWFKSSNASQGHIMTKADVIKAILKKLDSKQDKFFTRAMDDMVNEGIFEIQSDGVTLMLTQKGADLL